jgi:predicted metal-dependent phosphoesterase TrpH
MLARFDLHIHTTASHDSILSPEELTAVCRERGLAGLAVTDHNRLAGALALARESLPDLRIIAGEEVLTTQGELLGLFLREEIPAGLSAEEAARAIRAQGGLVGVPHPCDPWRQALQPWALEALRRAGLVDFLEGRNARVMWAGYNRRAEKLGRQLGLPLTAGSDAHSPGEVGACIVLLPPFSGPREFLAALEQGRLEGHASALTRVLTRIHRAWVRRRT